MDGEQDIDGAAPEEERAPRRWPEVYAGLKDAILSHRLAPGTKLPEDELASIYAVSRSVIRAALQALAHDRLARLEPNRGAFVAEPSRKEARETFEARSLIEPRVAALAAASADQDDIALLRAHLEEEHVAIRTGQESDAIALSARFHLTLAEIADHSIFHGMVEELVSRSSLIVALYWRRRDTTCETHAHHDLVEAIAKGDAKNASVLMRSHLVDLLSGLDLTLGEKKSQGLAALLRPTL
jgi:DNA-binding GntR family transcriptional regulator